MLQTVSPDFVRIDVDEISFFIGEHVTHLKWSIIFFKQNSQKKKENNEIDFWSHGHSCYNARCDVVV